MAREVIKELPGFSILYLGDTARTPYGDKSPEAVVRYALEDAEWLIEHGAKILVVACNTMSAVAIDALRDRFSLPIFDVIRPTVEEAIRISTLKRVGIIGTRATIQSKIYEKTIRAVNPDTDVFSAACPLFVPLVEEGWAESSEARSIAGKYLNELKSKRIDTLILGCTHYPFLKSVIASQMGRMALIDSSRAVVRHMRAFLDAHPQITDQLLKGNRHEFYLTDTAAHYNEIASRWVGFPIGFKKAVLNSLPAVEGK